MFVSRLHSLRNLGSIRFLFGSVQATTKAQTPQTSTRLQFTKAKLTDFGELPQGEIPEALKYDRPIGQTVLDNGVKVVSERFGSGLASVTVSVKAGSRYETLENSGVSQFLERLNQRGTQTRTREQVEQQLSAFGGLFQARTTREQQTYTLSFNPAHTEEAVAFLGDLLNNSLYSPAQVEAERDSVYRQAVDTKDNERVVVEAAHYTSYRDHYLGQPVTGVRENVVNVTAEHVRDFHSRHYVGENIVVAAAGQVNHETFVSAVNKAFGGVKSGNQPTYPNQEKPYFTPSIIQMRDDELANLNVGVFFDAPPQGHPDQLALQFFQQILGDYRVDKFTGAHLNTSTRQYNQLHAILGELPDVSVQRCHYFGYSDSGLFGNFLVGNEVFATQMAFVTQGVLSEYSGEVNQAEIYRARARFFNNLLSEENSAEVSQKIAQQVTYIGRRMPRSEVARRVSAFDAGHLKRVATRTFWDKDISVVMWGPTHLLASVSHYNRPWRRSTLGAYGMKAFYGV